MYATPSSVTTALRAPLAVGLEAIRCSVPFSSRWATVRVAAPAAAAYTVLRAGRKSRLSTPAPVSTFGHRRERRAAAALQGRGVHGAHARIGAVPHVHDAVPHRRRTRSHLALLPVALHFRDREFLHPADRLGVRVDHVGAAGPARGD